MMEAQKVNWGTLSPIPEICINRFGGTQGLNSDIDWVTSKAFFLTHCDYDALADLLNSDFLRQLDVDPGVLKLYLHEMAFHFLIYWTSTEYVKRPSETLAKLLKLKREEKIILLEKHVPIQLEFYRVEPNHEVQLVHNIQVTALSAGHDVGSIMLMFESISRSEVNFPKIPDEDLRILYTGNCRVTLRDLKRTKSLYQLDGDGSLKPFTHIYLDTKYFLETVQELPSRKSVTESLSRLIGREARRQSSLVLGFRTALKAGNLQFFRSFLQHTKLPILHVPENMSVYFQSIPGLRRASAIDGEQAQLHYDCDSYDCQHVFDDELCTPSGDIWGNSQLNMLQVSLGCDISPSPEFEKTIDERNWNEGGYHNYSEVELESGVETIRGIYPSQLSRFEAIRLIKFFGVEPNSVYPLYKGRNMELEQLNELIESSCHLEEDVETEPEGILEEYPSYYYDFTDTTYGNQDEN